MRMENSTQKLASPVEFPRIFRADNISVDLLKNKNPEKQNRTLDRADKQHQDTAGNCPNERAKKRDHVGYADNHADKQRIGRMQNAGSDKAEDSNDQGIQNFSNDEAAEHPVDQAHFADHMVGQTDAQTAVDDFFAWVIRRSLMFSM